MCFYFRLTDKELPKGLMPMWLLTLLKLPRPRPLSSSHSNVP